MAIYGINGNNLNSAYDTNGEEISKAYNTAGNMVFQKEDTVLPIPSGTLTASDTIPLPDLYETGKGFTCTGLSKDDNYYYIGDIGTLSGTNYISQIVVTRDFINVERTIPLYSIFPDFVIIQGVTVDTSDGTLWCCDGAGNKIYHLTTGGQSRGNFSITRPTGVVHSSRDDTLWILTYENKILHVNKNGTIIESYDFAYNETLDQCFLDEGHGLLYITAGTNYSGHNNVYCFNINTHEQSIACVVDSYSVEGILIEPTRMIILNDGLYHEATVMVNQANIYDLTD